jgi:hypothetical protein
VTGVGQLLSVADGTAVELVRTALGELIPEYAAARPAPKADRKTGPAAMIPN